MVARSSHPKAPPLGTRIDLRQAPKRAAGPKTLAYEGNLPLDPRLVFWLCGPRRIDQAAKVMRQLGLATVEQRIVQVRMENPLFRLSMLIRRGLAPKNANARM